MMVPLATNLVADSPHRVRATACFENKKAGRQGADHLDAVRPGSFRSKKAVNDLDFADEVDRWSDGF
jgi:hypothetical protein